MYLEGRARNCDLYNLKPDLLAATFGVTQYKDRWTLDISVQRGENVHKSEQLELRLLDGATFVTETPDGYEIHIMAVINEDESRTIPVPLQKL